MRIFPLRRAILAGAAAAAVLLPAACSSHGATPGMDHAAPTTPASPSSQSGTFNDTDVAFAQQMIPHHQQAVVMADLATSRASDSQVKSLAAQIKAAQAPEIATMTGWLSAWGRPTTAPSKSGMDHSDMGDSGMEGSAMSGMMSEADMNRLTGLSGAAFDREFCTMMIEHHEGAITMANDEHAAGANAEAKSLAQQIITGQQAEIDTMKTIVARL